MSENGGGESGSFWRVKVSEISDLPLNLATALIELVEAFERNQLRYAMIGGLATGFRSRPRFTQDIDLLLDVPRIVLPSLLDDLQVHGFTFDQQATIREWCNHHTAAISFRGVPIDWLGPVLPIFRHMLDTAVAEPWLGSSVRIASAESLILCKLIAFRTQDQADIESLLASNRSRLDLELIWREWSTVAEPNDTRSIRFEQMVAQFYEVTGS